MTPEPPTIVPATIAVVGVGLIGGSVALAARKRLGARVVGIGRDAMRIAEAVDAGVLQGGGTDADVASDADLVVVCTPVDRIPHDVQTIAGSLSSGAVITDVGSVKASICRQLADAALPPSVSFVGSHPIAGSEKRGWRNADADLFAGRVCVVTPTADSDAAAIERVSAFWTSLGMRVIQTSPELHDAALARTSHLPHLAAAALTGLLSNDDLDFVGTGFRDTTRIASGDPDLWTAIFQSNAGPLLNESQRLIERLQEFRQAIEQRDAQRLRQMLQDAQVRREDADEARQTP